MHLFKNNLFNKCLNLRSFSSKKTFPLDKGYIEEMPVFQYIDCPREKKRIYVWGNATTGALGVFKSKKKERTNFEYIKNPKRLTLLGSTNVIAVACGFGFSAFAVKLGTKQMLYGSGINTDSQIGFHHARENKYLELICVPQPICIPFAQPEITQIRKLSAGRAHLAVLTDEGLFLLGNNAYGQCGRNIVENESYSGNSFIHHIKDVDDEEIIDVVCGQDHTILLTDKGHVYTCGWGADGQTGLGYFKETSKFTRVEGDLSNEKIVKVSCRSDFVLAVNNLGDVFGWGNTEYCQISTLDNCQQIAVPTHIRMCKKLGKIIDVAAGGTFCLVLNDDGNVFVWGFGLLGTGPQTQCSREPIKIPEQLFGLNDFNPDTKVEKVSCGLSHMAAITNKGDLFTWGRNREHCLGLGSDKDQYFPLKVAIGGFVKEVACGIDHTIAICEGYI